jgi:hypothetical protein
MPDFGKVLGRREEEEMWREERGPGGVLLGGGHGPGRGPVLAYEYRSACNIETIFNVQIFQHG